MPITKSAKKALLVDRRRKEENDLTRAKVKSALKGTRLSIAAKKDDVAEKMQQLFRELDLAVKKNVIHKNKASRLKSRANKAAVKQEIKPVIKKSNKSKAKAKSKKLAKTAK